VPAREEPHLRLPAAAVAGVLVDEDERLPGPRLLEVELYAVFGDCMRHGQAPRLSTTPESLPARGEARKTTVSATCSGSIMWPNEPVPISSSQRFSSPSFSFAAALMSGTMRSVRVAGGCTPSTRTPNAVEPLPMALVKAPRPA